MAKNWKNYYLDNAVHHVTGTVHQWQPILLYPEIVESVYEEFNRKASDFSISLMAYVLMPEHFHLLIRSAAGAQIKSFLQSARRSISGKAKIVIESNHYKLRRYCQNRGVDIQSFYELTAGKSQFRFWKEKPRVVAILNAQDIGRKIDYIHNNPVRRGLVEYPNQWPHSSFMTIVEGKAMASGCHLSQIPS